MIIFKVEGIPIAQPRYHTGKNFSYIRKTSTGKVHSIDGWKERIYWTCFNAVGDLDNYPLEGRVEISLEFIFERPKRTKKSVIYKKTKPDIDNLIKAVLDAMNKVIYKDDNRVCKLSAVKKYGDSPCVKITIGEINE